MYKDKEKQREATKKAMRRHRDRQRVRESCVIPDRDTHSVIPNVIPKCDVVITKADSHVDVTDISTVKALHQGISEQALPDKIEAIPGQCWCCGNDIGPSLVCCGPCAWTGKAKEERAGRYPPLLTDRTPEQMEADLHAQVLTGPGLVTGKPGDDDYNGICR